MTHVSFSRGVRTGCNQGSRGRRSILRFRALPEIRKVELVAIMSAIGPKQTSVSALHMSALGGKADITVYGNPLLRSLLGVKRTSLVALRMSANDPKRTSRRSRWLMAVVKIKLTRRSTACGAPAGSTVGSHCVSGWSCRPGRTSVPSRCALNSVRGQRAGSRTTC